MRNLALALTVVCSLLVHACSGAPDVTLTLAVDSSEPRVVAETARILRRRFEEFLPSMFSSVESTVDDSTISFTFKRGAPPQPTVEFLYRTRGTVRASLADASSAPTWFTDEDIADAAFGYEGSAPRLLLHLTPEAGDRVLQLTSRNVGKVLRISLDQEVLYEATINGVFGRSFQMPAPGDGATGLALSVIFRTGALPARVSTPQASI